MVATPAKSPAEQAVSRRRESIQLATRRRSDSVSLESTGGIVRLRNCAATSTQRPRLASMSLAVEALRKLMRFLGLAGLWQAEQFCTSTGRMVSKVSAANAAPHARASEVRRRYPIKAVSRYHRR